MNTARRRIISIPGVALTAVLLTLLLPVWLPVSVLIDVGRGRRRLPLARLLAFALGWSWLETAGVAIAAVLWITGRRRSRPAHYRLQRWWAANLMTVLRTTTGLDIEVDGIESFSPGPAVVLCRHASLADSLVSAWVITTLAHMQPRYVLKRELLADPCLDVVGNRLPNHFVDREAADSTAELDALTRLSAGMGVGDVAVIFPEGTRAAPAKRLRALERIAERDPERALRLAPLQHLLPPRPAGTAALIEGCPAADIVIAWHVGFEGLDTFGGIVRAIGRGAPHVRFAALRIPRSDVAIQQLTPWLDECWLRADRAVDALLRKES
jgi:1-acyl-sn-glycerol-3-phosphate acyltransferase